MTADARVTAWLDRLEGLHTATSEGPWRVATPFTKLIDVADREDAVTAERPADAAAIVAEHNNFAALLALARGVTALADEWTVAASYSGDNSGYDKGLAAAFDTAADRLRRLLADAAPDTGEETA